MPRPLTGRPNGRPPGISSDQGAAAEANARAAFLEKQAHEIWREHRCANCYIPGFGRSALPCPNEQAAA